MEVVFHLFKLRPINVKRLLLFEDLRIIFYLEIVLSLADWLCEASQGDLFPVKAKTYGAYCTSTRSQSQLAC